MASRLIKTNNGSVTLYEPPFTPEEQAIVERGLNDPPRTIARLTPDPPRCQPESPQVLPEA